LEAVRLQRGIRYPREVIALLLGEERARLQNGVTAHAERPELSTLNAGVLVRAIIGCVPNASSADQHALSDLLSPLFRAAIEGNHASGEKLSLLRLLTFVPQSDFAVERMTALAVTSGVSVTTRRSLTRVVENLFANAERERLYDLLEGALEGLVWNGLLRA
jgi:hypothetical protein